MGQKRCATIWRYLHLLDLQYLKENPREAQEVAKSGRQTSRIYTIGS